MNALQVDAGTVATLWACVDEMITLAVPTVYKAAWSEARAELAKGDRNDPERALAEAVPMLRGGVELLARVTHRNAPERAVAALREQIKTLQSWRAAAAAEAAKFARYAAEAERLRLEALAAQSAAAAIEPATESPPPSPVRDPAVALAPTLPHVPDTQPEGPVLTDEVPPG